MVHHHLGMWVNVALLELSVLLLKLPLDASLHIRVVKVFVSLLDCKHNLTALITELHPLKTVIVFIREFFLCSLGIFSCVVVDECMWSIFGVRFSLLHPDCPDLTVLGEHLVHD